MLGISLAILASLTWGLGAIEFKRMATGGLKWNKPLLFLALSGLLYGVAHLSSFVALAVAPIIIVVPLANTATLVTVAGAHVFLRRLERVSIRVVAGGLLVVRSRTGDARNGIDTLDDDLPQLGDNHESET